MAAHLRVISQSHKNRRATKTALLSLKFCPRVEELEPREVPALTITVNTTDDTDARDNKLSIREAILLSNSKGATPAGLTVAEQAQVVANPGTNVINFNIGNGDQRIEVLLASGGALPAIDSEPVIINGAPPAGFVTQWIILDGAKAGKNVDGLSIEVSGCTVKGLEVTEFSLNGIVRDNVADTWIGARGGDDERVVVNENLDNGIFITGADATDNTVINCYIGTDRSGLAAAANDFNGVSLDNGAHGNKIGNGLDPLDRNIISGNGASGVFIGPNSGPNTVSGNYIGTDPLGTGAIPNSIGVEILSNDNTIGEVAPAPSGSIDEPANVISGNTNEGIRIHNAIQTPRSGISVFGNFIGLQPNGTSALGNGGDGISITGDSEDNYIGEYLSPGKGNVISDNGGSGIYAEGKSTNLRIESNIIGSDKYRSYDHGNADFGIYMKDAARPMVLLNMLNFNRQGGGRFENVQGLNQGTVFENIVLGSNGRGLEFINCEDLDVVANYIGTDSTGTALYGNGGDGVYVDDGSNVALLDNVIANNAGHGIFLTNANDTYIGANTGVGNLIINNALDGICVVDGAGDSESNTVVGNSIYGNGGIGIDLNDDGHSANDSNDPDEAANRTQNHPEVFQDSSGVLRVRVQSTPNTGVWVQVYQSKAALPNYAGGERAHVGVGGNADAAGMFEITLPGPNTGSGY